MDDYKQEIIDYLVSMGNSMCEEKSIAQDYEERDRDRRDRDRRAREGYRSRSDRRALEAEILKRMLSKGEPQAYSPPLLQCPDLEEMFQYKNGDPSWVMAGRLAYHLMKNFEMTDTQIRSDFTFSMAHYNGRHEIIITDEEAVCHMTHRIYPICVGGMLFEFNPKKGVVQVLPPRSSMPTLDEYRSIIKQTFRCLKVTMKDISNNKQKV